MTKAKVYSKQVSLHIRNQYGSSTWHKIDFLKK